jgi:serine phosphatase RsbU (regulator of sigma subunit)/TPR repeat protein
MRNHKKFQYIITCSLLCITFNLFSQNKKLDSLLTILNSTKNDTIYCNILGEAIDVSSDKEKSDLNNKQITFIEIKLKNERNLKLIAFYKRHLSDSYIIKGNLLVDELKINEAINQFEKSLQISESIKDSSSVSVIYQILGGVARKQSNYPKALEYFKKSLIIEEKKNAIDLIPFPLSEIAHTYNELKDTTNTVFYLNKMLNNALENKDTFALAYVYRKLGEINSCKGNLKEALSYFDKSIICYNAQNQRGLVAFIYQAKGFAYSYKGDYRNAIIQMDKGVKLYEMIGTRLGLADGLHNFGTMYFDKKDYDSALLYFQKSLKLRNDSSDAEDIINTCNKLAEIYLISGEYKKAEEFGLKSFGYSKKLGYPKYLKSTTELLYKAYKIQNFANKALEMYEIFIQMRDSIDNDEIRKTSIKNQFETEYAKKTITDSLKISEERKVNNLKFEKEKTQRFALYGGLALVLIFTGFIFNRFKISQKQKGIIENQKHLVEEKHKEITDSINYAERIQRSFLATSTLLDNNLKDYFVYFKPKDVVSGDFYWAKVLSNETFALVTADSTGHGVPGAIMSLLNITSLESAVKDSIVEPSEILNHTRKTIIERLKLDGSIEGGKDGMDASLVCFDFKNSKFIYTTANNPIWIVRNNELIELKGDKMPVGKHDKDQVPFTQQEFEMNNGDVVYTLTDGFPDQFGGAKGKKFMYKQLKETLVSISQKPMSEQKETLNSILKNWMGDVEQVDDITIIGIRI